ncbi:MAG TPA: acetyltransferase [Cyclobacteriaceae bacterium]
MSIKKIAILGSGGFSKEVFFVIQEIGTYEFIGFIDLDKKEDVVIGGTSYKVFAEKELSSIDDEFILAIGVGDPKLIKRMTDRLKDKYHFPNLIHPSVIGNFTDIEMGEGNIITANCIFTTSIKIGSFNVFNLATTVGHDVVIGNCNVLNPTVNVSGGVIIGDNNLIGVNATILQHKSIGSNSIVGASSLVTKNVEDNVTVIGTPAKVLHKIN